jgi:hypothetical protein
MPNILEDPKKRRVPLATSPLLSSGVPLPTPRPSPGMSGTGGTMGSAVLDPRQPANPYLNPPMPKKVDAPLPTMPIMDDEEVTKARRRSLQAQTRRRGRASTILSDRDTLG